MADICEECKYCWNYKVSEVGCFGSDKPCEHYVGDDREEVLKKRGVIANAKNRNDKTCCQTLSRQKETMLGDRARESRVDFGNI